VIWALPLLLAASAPTVPGPDPTFLRAFAETRGFLLGRPTAIRPTPDGAAVLFLRSPPRQPTLALYEMSVSTGQVRELVTPAQLLGGAEEQLSVAEKARRERMRIVDRGFTSYGLSEDGRLVMLPLSGRVYVYDRAGPHAGRVRKVGEPGVIDPRFSPDGIHVAYVRGQDLYVADVESGKERRLTKGGSESRTHGLAEFVAQEEMDRFEGYFWSADSKTIAYTDVDVTGLERFTIADPAKPEQPANTFPYPRAGQANAKVRLGLIPAAGGATTWVKWDSERYPYLARVIWKEKKAPLTLVVEARDQRELALLTVDPRTGATRPLHLEKDQAWVELDVDLPRWLPDGSRFLVASERSGERALELYKADGTLDRVLWPKDFQQLVYVSEDSKRGFFLASNPISTWLGAIDFETGKAAALGWELGAEHSVVVSKNGAALVDTRTTIDSLAVSDVYRLDVRPWKKVGVLPSVAEAPPFRAKVELTTTDKTPAGFHAAIIRPRAFQPGRKYPVVVNVYGGPTSMMVRSDERQYLLAQWIADHGVIVVAIDNRGTERRGRAWSRAIKGSFGKIPLDDQVAALKALGARYPELDLSRVGIYGWSFGGYMAALAVLRRPDVFKVGVAGAPVVDWRDYDTHYTERYLDLPQANKAGYDESSLLTYAPKLERPLLLVHGTGDDNVYFFHSLKLADALFRAGRPFEFLPLSVTHQVPEAVVRERLWQRTVDFLLRNLR
jgi:dipeptidyl-peptidase-4